MMASLPPSTAGCCAPQTQQCAVSTIPPCHDASAPRRRTALKIGQPQQPQPSSPYHAASKCSTPSLPIPCRPRECSQQHRRSSTYLRPRSALQRPERSSFPRIHAYTYGPRHRRPAHPACLPPNASSGTGAGLASCGLGLAPKTQNPTWCRDCVRDTDRHGHELERTRTQVTRKPWRARRTPRRPRVIGCLAPHTPHQM